MGKSEGRRFILRWPKFCTLDLGQLGTEKSEKNCNMEVNGTEFSLRKNGTDAIGLGHPGWAKVMKNAIFALSAKSELYLDE